MIGDNAPNIAKEYIKELENNISFVEARTKSIQEKDKPTVLHIADGKNLLKIDGGKSIIGDWINKAGGKNAFPEQANLVEISQEEVVKINPEVIIIGGTNAPEGVEKIKQDPSWQSVSAVKMAVFLLIQLVLFLGIATALKKLYKFYGQQNYSIQHNLKMLIWYLKLNPFIKSTTTMI